LLQQHLLQPLGVEALGQRWWRWLIKELLPELRWRLQLD